MLSKIIAHIKNSLFYNKILSMATLLGKAFKKGVIYSFVMKPSFSGEKCKNSLFYALKENTTEAFSRLCRESAFAGIIKSSYFGRFFEVKYLFPVISFVMLLVPHEYWNNLYGVLCAFLLFIALVFSDDGYSFKDVSLYTVIFLISAIGGIFITPDKSDGFKMFLFILASLMFMRSAESGIKCEKSLLNLVWTIVIALFFMSIYAIVQNARGVSVDELLTDVVNNKGMAGRVFSTVENPNNFAEIIVLILPFTIALFLQSREIWKKVALLVIASVCILALMLTYTRGCYVSFAISVVVFIALYNWKWLLPLAVFGIICIPFLPQSVVNRVLTIGSDTSSAYRIFLWESTGALLRDNWLCGVGLGSEAFRIAYVPYAHRFAQNPAHSHMLYTQILAELGAIGALSFFAFMLSSLKKGFSSFNKANRNLRCIIIAAISSFAGISFSAATEYIWFYPRVMFTFFIVLGILLCAVKLEREKSN